MTDVQIFACGIAAGVVATIVVYHWSKRPKTSKSEPISWFNATKEIDPTKMEKVSDFNETDYTKEHFDLAARSIQIDTDWSTFVDHSEIKFEKFIKNVGGHDSSSVTVKFEYSFDSTKFRIGRSIVSTSSGRYGDNYYFEGVVDENTKKFLYKNYLDWKNKKNNDRKIETDKKLGVFNDMLGKSVGRDKKLDELLNS